ncbi:leucyl aminopeptidase family protein [Rhizobium leguminosarum]|uniref:leucyl aminopeptidase family protein n=1 Tax=Rhizobium leguminosarum TaxID=384 RepID=UPI003F962578
MRNPATLFSDDVETGAVPLILLTGDDLSQWLSEESSSAAAWCSVSCFQASPGQTCRLPDERTDTGRMLVGVRDVSSFWDYCAVVASLPAGTYRLISGVPNEKMPDFLLAWAYGQYRLDNYRSDVPSRDRVLCIRRDDRFRDVEALISATDIARSLIDLPSNDLGPIDLADAAISVVTAEGAEAKLILGDELEARFPCVKAVGRASSREPCFVDARWGDHGHPKVTIVGKGVCFDTGGLDLKSATSMRQMKRDMGGAAIALALAFLIMKARLPVHLRLLLPCAENSVGGNAFRPGDIIQTASGRTVEIGNTDAEGRLLLCDALTEACREQPDLLIDFATLTASARAALGPQIGVLISNRSDIGAEISAIGFDNDDPVWPLPLWRPYRKWLDSRLADLSSTTDAGMAGAIVAALYLSEFVPQSVPWVHVDTMAWNPSKEPGRPEGGEPIGLKALYYFVKHRYGGRT